MSCTVRGVDLLSLPSRDGDGVPGFPETFTVVPCRCFCVGGFASSMGGAIGMASDISTTTGSDTLSSCIMGTLAGMASDMLSAEDSGAVNSIGEGSSSLGAFTGTASFGGTVSMEVEEKVYVKRRELCFSVGGWTRITPPASGTIRFLNV